MLKLLVICLCLLTIYLDQSEAVVNPKVVCYYESWGHWRTGKGKMNVEDIDSSLCTHLVYAYLGITDSYTINVLDPWLMEDSKDLDKFVKNKGNAKALVAVGGSAQSAKFSLMAQTDADRTNFVNSVVTFLKKHHFDGVMIDWQYPGSKDMDNFVKLLDKFDEKFADTSFILGITAAPTQKTIDAGYDVKKIINYVNFVHVLTFDLHGLWDSKVDHAAPLDWQIASLKYWWSKGAPREKLLMSIPLFARTWTLANPENSEVTASATGPGRAGPYTKAEGLLSYNELCAEIKESPSEWVIRRDSDGSGVYAVHGRNWVSFEDSKTCAVKAKNATTEGFGGVVAYALTNEDFHGDCGGNKFPLLHGINSGINHEAVTVGTAPTEDPKVTHPTKAPVTDTPGKFTCHKVGKFRDPLYCQEYHECIETDIHGLWEDKIGRCDRAQAFDEVASKCVDKAQIPICNH